MPSIVIIVSPKVSGARTIETSGITLLLKKTSVIIKETKISLGEYNEQSKYTHVVINKYTKEIPTVD